ncbi:MAG: glycine betaine ABC transporter substrate-binding protein [Methanoregulaceae archaeon]|jgi:glycine betaine/proline transport system substrate-binding protein|nr:glycine betaine ABC transporter substrate-binding protein [Methanoregulaceae archaeon]
MSERKLTKIFIMLAVSLVLVGGLVVCGCTTTEDTGAVGQQKEITIGYVTWDSEIASTNVLRQAFEQAGYDVELVAVDVGPLYQALAKGDVDCTVSAWLPGTHKTYMDEYGDDFVMVGKNLEGAKIGLVVPEYVTIDSIEDLNAEKEKFDGKIIGIEPGAGIMRLTEDAIEEYGLDFTLISSSSAGMAAELRSSINDGDWIVVTGWTPHWKFARWDLKYLEDPKGVYGGDEYIAALARTGLETDKPEAYTILTRFYWTPEDMESVMLAIEEGKSPEVAAKEWVDANQDVVDAWIA